MANKKLEGVVYNEAIKERFLANSGWGDEFIYYNRTLFKHTARLEESLQKDVHDFTAQETSDLLHLLQLKSRGQVILVVSALSKYLTWAYRENLTTNPVNYFSSLYNSDNANDYVSNLAKQSRLITEEQLLDYESQLTVIGDYVDAALLRCCFLGLRGTKSKELLGLTINMIKPNFIALEKRNVPISDYERRLIISAHEQPEMVSLKGENNSNKISVLLPCDYIFKAVNKLQPFVYSAFAGKLLLIGEYVQHSNLTATNLYFSGMVNALNKMMEKDNTNAEVVFEGRSQKYFETLCKQFGYEGETRYLKYKLQDYYADS